MKYIVFKKVRIAADGNTYTTHLLKILKKEQRGPPRLFTRLDGSYLANTHIITRLRL